MSKIDKKQIIIVSLIIIVAIIFVPVYFYVLADDSDANKIEIKSSKVSNILDGEGNFDLTDEDGNDSSDHNGLVRTFDSATYTINYKLGAKENEEIDTSADNRIVVVDVLLPETVKAKVTASATSESIYLDSDDSVASGNCDQREGLIVFTGGENKYRYAEFIIHDQGINNEISLNITISDIYGENNQEFEPIFLIKESTDTSKRSMGELTCAELQGDYNDFRSSFYEVSNCENEISGANICNLRITGTASYAISLYTGEYLRETEDTSKIYPIGVLVSLLEKEGKGIKGSIVPSEIDINFNIDSGGINLNPRDYKVYKSSSSQNEYRVLTQDSSELPELNNGTVTSNESNNMHISNIKYKGNNLISSNVFFVSYDRESYDYEDKTFTISCENGGSTNIINNYGFTLGDYYSNVELFNTLDSEKEIYGIANFNYNQDFYIRENFSYSGSGDGVTNLTNYLKIDNDAVNIITNDENLDYKLEVNSFGKLDNVTFGYGEWNSNYFDLTYSDGCPDSFDDLSREDIMNLYGGPCISEKANIIKWVSTLDSQDLDDIDKQRGPILVKTVIKGDESKRDLILPGLEANITLKAKVKGDYLLSGNSYQIVSNSTSYGNGLLRYMGISTFPGEEIIKNIDNFIKTEINPDNLVINRNICENEVCPISGNTILVSGVKVAKPTVSYYRNNKETSNFYYYPIETRINATATNNDAGAEFTKADIYVDMPSYMEYIDYDNSETAKKPIEVTPLIINDISYNRYHYVFESNEINNGEINTLKIFTNISMDTKNGIVPTIYITSDFTIGKEIYISSDEKTTVYMNSIMPKDYRATTSSSITIYNGSDITTQGITTPSNIEKNGSYTYKMRAYNNSNNNGNALSYPNASLYFVVPYKGDSSYSDLSSDFEATGFKIKLNEALPSGYSIYYTTALPSNIINEEINTSSNIEWTTWNNPTTEKSNITGIKITKNSNFDYDNYFISNEGISLTVTPINSEEGDIYYNVFYIISDKPNNYECTSEDEACSLTNNKKLYYSSSRTVTSIYNRKISGYVFEDYDENGIYSSDESRLENIPVSLYRIDGNISNFDPKNPATFVTENDVLVAESVTGSNGEYSFRGISKGNYYVKYKYNDEHYVPTENSIVNPNIPGSSKNNSKASILPNTNIAISNIISFGGNTTEYDDINLGLKIKKEFKVDIKKYITNVQIISDNNIENFDYNNATTVTINVRNPKNAKVRVKYSFYVENVKYYPGYVGMIVDAMPEGMTFNPNLKENQDWVSYDGNLYYNGLSGAILLPNQKMPFSLVLEAPLTKGGNYVNSVSVKDLVLMGDELPRYDFNTLNVVNEGGE